MSSIEQLEKGLDNLYEQIGDNRTAEATVMVGWVLLDIAQSLQKLANPAIEVKSDVYQAKMPNLE